MYRNKENDVAPQASPDISLQKRKKIQKYGQQDWEEGPWTEVLKIYFRFSFFFHSMPALIGSLKKSMRSTGI